MTTKRVRNPNQPSRLFQNAKFKKLQFMTHPLVGVVAEVAMKVNKSSVQVRDIWRQYEYTGSYIPENRETVEIMLELVEARFRESRRARKTIEALVNEQTKMLQHAQLRRADELD